MKRQAANESVLSMHEGLARQLVSHWYCH